MENELNLQAVCQLLNKSKRIVTRYIKAGKLKPKKIKSKKGTIEYRFSQSEVESLKKRDRGQMTGQETK